MKTQVMMVELARGYGDGYALVEYRGGKPVIHPRTKGPYATQPAGIELLDSGVRVAGAPIVRVIGPSGSTEATRIKMKLFTKNWSDGAFADRASDEEVAEVAALMNDPSVHSSRIMAAVQILEEKYAD